MLMSKACLRMTTASMMQSRPCFLGWQGINSSQQSKPASHVALQPPLASLTATQTQAALSIGFRSWQAGLPLI
jgi:hypothetical protein